MLRSRAISKPASAARSRPVGLAEAVAGIRYAERAVLLRGYLQIISGPVVLGRRRRLLSLCWRGKRRYRYSRRLLIVQVCDEHAGNRILLSTEQREVNLPDI